MLWAVGGQHTSGGSDGVYLLRGERLSDLLHGSWFPPPSNVTSPPPPPTLHTDATLLAPPPPPPKARVLRPKRPASIRDQRREKLFDGTHAGCVERRGVGMPCEYDGKFSLAYHRAHGRFYLYSRANLKAEGGRHVQVASSAPGQPTNFSAFAPLTISGYDSNGPGNIYLASVKSNPADQHGGTMLGLFAVNLGKEGEPNGVGKSFIGLSISCDGAFWAPLIVVIGCHGAHAGRTYDHPVDGFDVHGDKVYVLLHRDVPGISPRWRTRARIEWHRLREPLLRRLTNAAYATLPGCVRQR